MLALLLVAVSVGVDNFAAAIAIGVSGVDARTRLRVGLVFGVFEAGMPVLGLVIGAQTASLLGHMARWVGAALLVAVGGYTIIAAAREKARSRRVAASPDPGADEARRSSNADSPGPDGADGPAGAYGTDRPAGADSAARPAGADGSAGQESPGLPRRAPPTAFGRLLLSGLALSLDNLVVGFALGTSHVTVWLGAIVIGAVSAGLSLAGLELGARAGRWAGERSEQLAGGLLIFVGVALGTGLLG